MTGGPSRYMAITLRNGMCNQLMQIAYGIVLAHLTNRTLVISGLLKEYEDDPANVSREPIEKLLDIKSIESFAQSKMRFLDFKITSENSVDMASFIKVDYGSREMTGDNMAMTLQSDKYNCINNVNADYTFFAFQDYKIPYINTFFSALVFDSDLQSSSFAMANKTIEHVLSKSTGESKFSISKDKPNEKIHCDKSNINRFSLSYNQIIQNDTSATQRLVVVHLRLENDMLSHFQHIQPNPRYYGGIEDISDIFVDCYLKAIVKYVRPCDVVILCTALGKGKTKNRNDFILPILKEHYPNMVIFGREAFSEFHSKDHRIEGREMHAVVESIIAQKADVFIGLDYSTFSSFIAARLPPTSETYLLTFFKDILTRSSFQPRTDMLNPAVIEAYFSA